MAPSQVGPNVWTVTCISLNKCIIQWTHAAQMMHGDSVSTQAVTVGGKMKQGERPKDIRVCPVLLLGVLGQRGASPRRCVRPSGLPQTSRPTARVPASLLSLSPERSLPPPSLIRTSPGVWPVLLRPGRLRGGWGRPRGQLWEAVPYRSCSLLTLRLFSFSTLNSCTVNSQFDFVTLSMMIFSTMYHLKKVRIPQEHGCH